MSHPGRRLTTKWWASAREAAGDEDGRSCRYAVVNLGGDSRGELRERIDATVARLGIILESTAD